MEVWKAIPGVDLYEASSLGRIRRIGITRGKAGKPLATFSSGKTGYRKVSLCVDGVVRKRFVHDLVALAFHEKPEWADRVDHENRHRSDNREDNLRWATSMLNSASSDHSHRNAAGFRGVCRKRAKWAAYGTDGEKTLYLGTADTPEAAAALYDAHALSRYGEFAHLNFGGLV